VVISMGKKHKHLRCEPCCPAPEPARPDNSESMKIAEATLAGLCSSEDPQIQLKAAELLLTFGWQI